MILVFQDIFLLEKRKYKKSRFNNDRKRQIKNHEKRLVDSG